jgi:hypothetical protein
LVEKNPRKGYGSSASVSLVKDPLRVIQTNDDSGSFGKKRRSTWYYLAQSSFNRMRDLGKLESDRLLELEKYFDRWREIQIQKHVRLEGSEDWLFIKCCSRFDESYRSKIRDSLRKLDRLGWDLKIELTIDPKRFMRYSDEFFFLKNGWNRLRSWLIRRYGSFDFFDVMEIQKSGRPHYHILLRGVKWIDQGELSDLWDSYGCGKIVYLKSINPRNNVKMSSYVLKYVNKTLNQADKRFAAVLFASNRRLFSLSRNVQISLHAGEVAPQHQGYEFNGSVPSNLVRSYCREHDIEGSDKVWIKKSDPDVCDWKDLFGLEEAG